MGRMFIFLIILILIENKPPCASSINEQTEDFPLTRSLGYSIKNKLDKTLEDARINQEYMAQYHELMRVSQESFESFEDREERRLRRGEDNLDSIRDGAVRDRRRSASWLGSAFGHRRARSQASRRDKLNSQSLRSHMHHSRNLNRQDYD